MYNCSSELPFLYIYATMANCPTLTGRLKSWYMNSIEIWKIIKRYLCPCSDIICRVWMVSFKCLVWMLKGACCVWRILNLYDYQIFSLKFTFKLQYTSWSQTQYQQYTVRGWQKQSMMSALPVVVFSGSSVSTSTWKSPLITSRKKSGGLLFSWIV